jgi:formylglycine-generating enzyme required for sulfatase activity
MKRKTLYFISVTLLLVLTIACKKEPVTGVNIAPAILDLSVGQTSTLSIVVIPNNASNQNVSWTTSNSSVATVEDGIVTGVAIGRATITVTTEDGHRTATCLVNVVQPIEPEMVWVEGGKFLMGCNDDECIIQELPAHEVTLTGFNIAIYPVTQKEWNAIINNNPSNHKGDNFPVEMVTWEDIQKFIQKLNTLTGKHYRLPTEAEWEYTARGGNKSQGFKYSGSDNVDDVAWINGLTHTVGAKASNELGIYDMSGNVFELCSDWYGNYTNDPQNNPQGHAEGNKGRVIRGGNYGNIALYCRIAYRMPDSNSKAMNMGFRLVLPKE